MLIRAHLEHMARAVKRAVIATMEPRVITLMGDVTVYQATPDLCVKKNVHTEPTDKIAKKNANAKMKANVMCPMEAVSVVMVGRVRSVKKGFVRERNYMARSAR